MTNLRIVPTDENCNCYVCKKHDINPEYKTINYYRSVGFRNIDEGSYEIQYLELAISIPLCKECFASKKKESRMECINFYVCVMLMVIPFFFISNIIISILISLAAIFIYFVFLRTIHPSKGIRKVIPVVESHPLIKDLQDNDRFWCLDKPSRQSMPAWNLAIPENGDYNSYFMSLVKELYEIAKRYEYKVELVSNPLNTDKFIRR